MAEQALVSAETDHSLSCVPGGQVPAASGSATPAAGSRRAATEAEAARLAAVRRYDILDSPPNGAFDRITALASRLLRVPIAIVSIVDADRIWFASAHGLGVTEIERSPGLCASAILQDQPWVIEDATVDPRTLTNPLVTGMLGLRFYAGVPLVTHDGYNLGTLNVIDVSPRVLEAAEMATLSDLAAIVMDELEMRLAARRTVGLQSDLRRQAEQVARTLQESLLPPDLPIVPRLTLAARYHVAHQDQVGGDFYDVIPSEDNCTIMVGDVSGKGTPAAALTATARWTLRSVIADSGTPASAISHLNRIMVEAFDNPESYCTLALARIVPTAAGAEVTLALGGHPQPLILRADGSVEALGETNPAVGWLPESTFTETVGWLGAGDCLLMFTDGLIEALQHGAVDDRRVHDLLSGRRASSPADLAAAIDAELHPNLRDDVAFLIVRAD